MLCLVCEISYEIITCVCLTYVEERGKISDFFTSGYTIQYTKKYEMIKNHFACKHNLNLNMKIRKWKVLSLHHEII